MDKKLVEQIIADLKSGMEKGQKIFFGSNEYEGMEITSNNFHDIEKIKSDGTKVAFVDGGNQEIASGSNFCLQLQRVCAVIFKDNKHVKSVLHEYFLYIKTLKKEKELLYEANVFGVKNTPEINKLMFNAFDPMLKQGHFRADIRKIGDIFRRIAELKVCGKVVDELDEKDAVVIDGDLQFLTEEEKRCLEELFKSASSKKITVCALSKTESFVTNKGNSAAYLLNKMAPLSKWYYYPAFESKKVNDIMFVKLQEKSEHIFRFEFLKKDIDEIKKIILILSQNSKDPVFIGYPYGLIKADKIARVSNCDKDIARTKLSFALGKHWRELFMHSSSLNAHGILDRISY